jgi:phosphoglycolate phosphatase-like HAD superfamily hydrolase
MLTISPQHEFLVGIDSDGCVFDSMELKHKECFIPHFIRCFGLQPVSKYARQTAEFVNLYSKSRGANRFVTLTRQLELLSRRPEVKARGVRVPRLAGLEAWTRRETRLGHPTLEAAVAETGDADLEQVLEWSMAVNQTVAEMVPGLPPFLHVRECFERMSRRADMIVCSQTPQAALEREWGAQGLSPFIQGICGQERGSKTEVLTAATRHFARERMLMIGDAPGDRAIRRPRRRQVVSFFRSIRGMKRQAGSDCWMKGSSDFLPAPLPATIRRDCWMNSSDCCLPSRPGRWTK